MSFWYLATPYTKYPGGIEEAYKIACKGAAVLLKSGIHVYSPIAHTHGVALHGEINPLAHEIWLPADRPFMEAARGLIVLRAESWHESYGISVEIDEFRAMGKDIHFMDPFFVPEKLR